MTRPPPLLTHHLFPLKRFRSFRYGWKGSREGEGKKNGQEQSFYPSKSLPACTQKLPLVFLLRIRVPRSGIDSFNPYAPYLLCMTLYLEFGRIWKYLLCSFSDPNPGFWWPKFKTISSWKKIHYLFDQKLQFTYPQASMKGSKLYLSNEHPV